GWRDRAWPDGRSRGDRSRPSIAPSTGPSPEERRLRHVTPGRDRCVGPRPPGREGPAPRHAGSGNADGTCTSPHPRVDAAGPGGKERHVEDRVSTVTLGAGRLAIDDVVAVARHRVPVVVDRAALSQLVNGRQALLQIAGSGQAIYGVTTGVGKLKDTVIPEEDRRRLQEHLVLSHAAGVGPTLGA